MRKLFILTLSILFVFPLVVFSGTTGKLTGVVIDSETKSPLPGANVMIDGTIFGAATDLEGNYIIINVPPGIYKVKAMMMGYTTTNITNVSVNVNLTSTVNFELKPTVLEMGEEVTIVADRELIQKDITSSRAIIGAEQIKEMPVENFRQVLELQAGVVQGSGGEMHVRGGRSSEVTYLVDGISVTDPYSSSMAVSVENSAIQELELVSGTFNAEYGQAMSGIVNIITKEGGKKYSGELRSYFGDYFSTNKNLYLNIDEIDPFSILDTQGSLSGPVPFTNNKLTFFTSGRHYNTDGYLYGIRRYSPSDSNSYPGEDPADWILNETGTGEFVPMSKYYKTTGQLKLAYNFKPSMKLTYNTLLERAQSKSYSHGYKYNPDGRPTSFKNAMNQIFTWTHTLSPMTFYSLKYSNIYNHGQSYVYADPLDSKYVDPKRFDRSRSYQFYMGGVSMGQYDRSTTTNIFKLEFTSQINKVHQIRAGAEYRWNKLFLNTYSLLVDQSTNWQPVIPDVTMLSHDRYTNYPHDFSCYIQDKIELKDMIVNIGVRFEYFDPNSKILTDERDPNLWKPYKYQILDAVSESGTYRVKVPVRIDPVTGEQTIIDPNTGDPMGAKHDNIQLLVLDSDKREAAKLLSNVTLLDTLTQQQISRGSMKWFEATTPKYQISPRIGIAYPITDRGVIHISYGHFLQIPNYSYLYANPEFEVSLGSSGSLMGNANLKPQKTVSYEIGLQQQLTDNIAVDITGFYKDIRNLLGTEIYKTYSQDFYALYMNRDYGNVRGITVAFKKRYSHYISGSFDYTFSVAEGNASDPNTAYYDKLNDRDPEKQLIYLNWDQTHTFNMSINISKPKNWGIGFIAQYGSGLPYTPTQAGIQGFQNLQTVFQNSSRKPATFNIDMRMHKDIFYKNLRFSLFCNIYNLLDRRNEKYVYSDTGKADYSLLQLRTEDQPGPNTVDEYFTRPYYFTAPRSIRAGIAVSFN